jgi:hypothetical protein
VPQRWLVSCRFLAPPTAVLSVGKSVLLTCPCTCTSYVCPWMLPPLLGCFLLPVDMAYASATGEMTLNHPASLPQPWETRSVRSMHSQMRAPCQTLQYLTVAYSSWSRTQFLDLLVQSLLALPRRMPSLHGSCHPEEARRARLWAWTKQHRTCRTRRNNGSWMQTRARDERGGWGGGQTVYV